MKKKLLNFFSLALCALLLIHVEIFPIVPGNGDEEPDSNSGNHDEEIMPCDNSETPGPGYDDF